MQVLYKRGRLAARKLWRNLRNPEETPTACIETADYCHEQVESAALLEYEPPKTKKATCGPVTCFPDPLPRFLATHGIPPNPVDFLVKLRTGRVYGCGMVITPDNRLLRDLSIEWDLLFDEGKLDHSLRHGGRLPKRQRVRGRVLLLESRGANNYYHFLFDCVSRFRLGEKYLDAVDWVYVTAKTPVQKEILSILKIPLEKILMPDGDSHIEFDEILAPSLSGPSPTTCEWLRKRFTQGRLPTKGRRIYVSRKDTSSRRALNEPALEGYLSKYGFETVCLSDQPFASQVELFASSEAVAGPHGAGLANLVFCNPGTKVIEILPPWYPSPSYVRIARACGLNHVVCLSDGERSETETRGRDDFVVNLNHLKSALEFLAIGGP